jgi:transcription elongation factor GreA
MNQEKTTLLTKEGVKKLKDELEERKAVTRREIANRIKEAKELGDLSENAEYASAKDDQGLNESRIIELQEKLKNYTIISKQKGNNVQIGSTVKLKTEEGEKMEFTIVGSSEADPSEKKISNESPLGAAFIGKAAGEDVIVDAPGGKMTYSIESVD